MVAQELVLGCFSGVQQQPGQDDTTRGLDDNDRLKDTRPRKKRRVGSLHCISRRMNSLDTSTRSSATARRGRCLRGITTATATTTTTTTLTATKSKPGFSSCRRSRKKIPPPLDKIAMASARRCSTMSLCTAPPSPSSPSLCLGSVGRSRVGGSRLSSPPLGTTTQQAMTKQRGRRRPPSLRKLLPKIGFSWAVYETRNRHTRKVERRLAGLEGRERRAILRGLSAEEKGGKGLGKGGVERGLVEVLEGGLGVLRGDGMKMRGLEDQSLFWEEVVEAYPQSWFGRGGITGEILHGLVLMTIEARLWDREHGVRIGWMDLARERSKLVRVVDEFIAWLEKNEDEMVKKGYFCGIEGAVHVDLLGGEGDEEARTSLLEELRAMYTVEAMDIYVDFDEQLAEELGDLMARLAIDTDEEMVDVDWEDWEWWSEDGIL
ncbi:hypothetical protein QBC41DRAFT_219216 [Cercophora samala]|uniref:Uncharacterized protein n=1 Tax=Cercophora samala TaxID=330535 RepID=A0AA40DCE5_9PEZI|nr:hypothetical protein QBC41DRAFT_219216 [Cercophora samala]